MTKYPKLCLCEWASTGRLTGDFSLFLPPRVFLTFHHLSLTKTVGFSRSEKIAIIVGSNPITKTWHLPKDLLTYCSPILQGSSDGTYISEGFFPFSDPCLFCKTCLRATTQAEFPKHLSKLCRVFVKVNADSKFSAGEHRRSQPQNHKSPRRQGRRL